MALNNYYFSACCDSSVIKTFEVEDTNFVIGDVVNYQNECYTYGGNVSIDSPDDSFTFPDYSGATPCDDCLLLYPCLYHFSACCITSGLTFSIPNVDIPQILNVGEVYQLTIISGSQFEFDACATIVTGITPSTIYSGVGYSISLTGVYVDCDECELSGTSCCVSGNVDSSQVFYVDCCGNYVSGGTPTEVVCFDPNYPFSGFSSWGDTCVPLCVSPTPTPTLTPTPTFTSTPTITPTPSSTPLPCDCAQYELRNLSLTDTANFTYYDCYEFEQNDFIPPDSVYEICCCEGTLIVPDYVLVTLKGGCSEFYPSPTPSHTATPTITPSYTTTTTTFCDFNQFCLQTGLSVLTTYDGEYLSAGTYGDKYYYTGGTEPGYLFYDGLNWCLSDTLGGSCLITGPTPSNSVCPDLSSGFFYTGVCVTTTTTTSPCDVFDFEAYFDCDYTTTTTTIIPCSGTSMDITVSAYTTTTTTVCNVGGDFTMVRYTTTTTTPSITTTTTTLSVFFSGIVTYTLFDEVVTCPNVSYKFQDCEDETIFYYTTTQPKYLEVPIEIGQVIQVYLNTYLKCVTFIGAVNSSADTILSGVVGTLSDCSLCGGTPANTPTQSVTPSVTPEPTPTSTIGLTPTQTPTNTSTMTQTPTNTPTPVSPTPTPTPTSSPTVITTFNVTNSGAAAYIINGSSNPTLNLSEGQTYTFNVAATGHPFWIKTTPVTGTGSAYNVGVTNNGTANGTITFTVPLGAPSTLYYICQIHSSMQGIINII